MVDKDTESELVIKRVSKLHVQETRKSSESRKTVDRFMRDFKLR